MTRPAFLEGGLAVLAGLALYGAVAGLEIALAVGPQFAAMLEESGKSVLILLAGWLGLQVRAAARECNPVKQARSQALGAARGVSLGLVAVTVFAGAENLAYLLAFPEAGILTRLLWSLPVHLVAALAEALGTLGLLRWWMGRGALRRRWVGLLLWFGTLALAVAWHLVANLLVSHRFTFWNFPLGVGIVTLLFLVLLLQFLRQAHLGGFLHGAD